MESIQALKEFCVQRNVEYQQTVSMKDYTTFHIGGTAALMLFPSNIEQVADTLRFCSESGLEPLILGNGSNLLVRDAGISRPVLHIGKRMSGLSLEEDYKIWCEAGASLARLCTFAQQHHLSGLEFAYGIPGSVGGALFMNAGAYGGEMKDVVAEVLCVTPDGQEQWFPAEACAFGYRQSVFAETGGCICGAKFRLTPGDPDAIRARMEELMQRRRDKQPLELPSAGSTFKRPEGNYASALIDQCGLKGYRVGGAAISEMHAGFVVNDRDATCADVLALIHDVQETVLRQTGYHLEREVWLVGDGES